MAHVPAAALMQAPARRAPMDASGAGSEPVASVVVFSSSSPSALAACPSTAAWAGGRVRGRWDTHPTRAFPAGCSWQRRHPAGNAAAIGWVNGMHRLVNDGARSSQNGSLNRPAARPRCPPSPGRFGRWRTSVACVSMPVHALPLSGTAVHEGLQMQPERAAQRRR